MVIVQKDDVEAALGYLVELHGVFWVFQELQIIAKIESGNLVDEDIVSIGEL